ncbi:uncharacterized protein LOC115012005 isoform X2 [Cottoperca gobio]|nr:uncharacterized protein LOC115012005 isoform X2 [Cottoperca gobio]
MAGLCWMALAFFLSAGDSLAAVDQSWLASVIEGIKNEYALGDTFSLAVNVPQNQDINDLQQVFQDDPADKVKQTVSQGQVYRGTRVVAAAQSQAVSRVLENIQPFVKSSQGNFLIIYSEKSPCGPTCTTNANDNSTSGEINDIIQNWSGYAFVFSRVVKVPAADTSQLSESFKRLGISKLGLDNIFRCYKPRDDPFQCSSCSSGGDVTPSCVANDAQSNQEQGVSESTGTDTGEETAPGEEMGAGIGGGTGGRVSRCKGRGSRKGGCKRRGGGRRGRGGVKRQCKRTGGCKRRGGGRRVRGGVKRQCKRTRGCKRRGGGRRGRGGRVRKVRKQRRGGRGGRRGNPRGGRRGKGKRRGNFRRRSNRRAGGRSRNRRRSRRGWGLQ